MPFEINLPRRIAAYTLRCAGMVVDAYIDTYMGGGKKKTVPYDVDLPYYLSEIPLRVTVTVLQMGDPVRLRISAPDQEVERAIHAYVQRYSAENDGCAVADRETLALWERIKRVLAREGLTRRDCVRGSSSIGKRLHR